LRQNTNGLRTAETQRIETSDTGEDVLRRKKEKLTMIEIIELEVRCDNRRAIHLYEKYGFIRHGTFPAFFKIGDEYIDFDLMHLDLR
jgi:ribosomal protein S18 acetylase RimI-like enzyme